MNQSNQAHYFIFLLILLCILLVQMIVPESFNLIPRGILPGNEYGWTGIVTAPFFHSGYIHLFSNLIPLIIMGWILFSVFGHKGWNILLIVLLSSGLGVYFLGRPSLHLGASGLVYGLASFLFFGGIFRRDRRSAAISLMILVTYSGMAVGVFPGEPHISWESHLYGAIGGLAAAWSFRNLNPYRPEEDYPWLMEESEDESETEDDGPVIRLPGRELGE